MSYHIISDDRDFGLSLFNQCHSCPTIEDAEKLIINDGRPGYDYQICKVEKIVRFKFDPTLVEVK